MCSIFGFLAYAPRLVTSQFMTKDYLIEIPPKTIIVILEII